MISSTNKSSGLKVKHSGRKVIFLAACVLFFLGLALATGMAMGPKGKVFIKKLKNSHYQLMAGNKPYFVKGVCYNPIAIGTNYEYDWWSDPAKPWMVDGKLMKEMGINTIRLYQTHENKQEVHQVIRDLYNNYGIRTILGHWLGFWEYPCPFYGDKEFQKRIKKDVLDMVKEYENEPGVLMWILGNENNYSCLGRVSPWTGEEVDKELDPAKKKEIRMRTYYSYINDISKEIHKIDKNHPVALGNGELAGLDYANKYCQDVDLLACIIYRGKTFGNLFRSLRATFDKPVMMAEFGADSYDAKLKIEDQNMQAYFLESQWRQIYDNIANNPKGSGNCIGGAMFEWTDEWWKHNQDNEESWKVHDTESNWSNGSYYFDIDVEGNKNMNEEWFGIVAISEKLENGLNQRIPRKAYYVVREFWKNPRPLSVKKKGKK